MYKLFRLLFGISIKKEKVNISKDDEEMFSRDELKDVLNRLYKCRDLEISNLWQRSIFLSVFMVLCFSGYGYLLLKIIDCYSACSLEPDKTVYLNIAGVALGAVSSIFSLLWIFMAKASKAWYEVYETAITTFEDEYREILKIPKSNIMGEMGLDIRKMSSCLYSPKAGAFSPSRINIAIGQVCFTIWVLVIIFHFTFLIRTSTSILYLPIIIVIVAIIIAGCLIFSKWIKSGHLSDFIYDKEGRWIGK